MPNIRAVMLAVLVGLATLTCAYPTLPFFSSPTESSGHLLLQDDFESGQGNWWIDWTGEGLAEVSEGRLRLSIPDTNSTAIAGHPDLDNLPASHQLQFILRQVRGSGSSYFAIAFRSLGPDDLATVYIGGNGSIALGLSTDGDYQEIIPWTHQAEPLGSDTLVTFTDLGDRIELHIEERLILSMPFEHLSPGEAYFFIGSYDDKGASWEIDALSASVTQDRRTDLPTDRPTTR